MHCMVIAEQNITFKYYFYTEHYKSSYAESFGWTQQGYELNLDPEQIPLRQVPGVWL